MWQNLLDECVGYNTYVWKKLINLLEDENKNFNHTGNMKSKTYSFYKLLVEQLKIEKDAYDINIVFNDNYCMLDFQIVCHGKLIKLYSKNSKMISFVDEEETIINDYVISELISRMTLNYKNLINLYGKLNVYIKFAEMPKDNIIKSLKDCNINVSLLSEPTPEIEYYKFMKTNVVLDQSIIITLCSDLSYDDEIYIDNYRNLVESLKDKKLYVTLNTIDGVHKKIEIIANSSEKKRFYELKDQFIYVPDTINNKFNGSEEEIVLISTCIKCYATLITCHKKLIKRINSSIPEINNKLFLSAQLVGKN